MEPVNNYATEVPGAQSPQKQAIMGNPPNRPEENQ